MEPVTLGEATSGRGRTGAIPLAVSVVKLAKSGMEKKGVPPWL